MRFSRIRDFLRMAEMVYDHSQISPAPYFRFRNSMPLFQIDPRRALEDSFLIPYHAGSDPKHGQHAEKPNHSENPFSQQNRKTRVFKLGHF